MHCDPGTIQAVVDHLRPILSDWMGNVDALDHTATYGIRRYYNGSVCVWRMAQMLRSSARLPHESSTYIHDTTRLRDHVDLEQTHIVSAILNVAQDTETAWELHILDHLGRRHFVDMAPGDSEFSAFKFTT